MQKRKCEILKWLMQEVMKSCIQMFYTDKVGTENGQSSDCFLDVFLFLMFFFSHRQIEFVH